MRTFGIRSLIGLLFVAPVLALITFNSYVPFVWNLLLSFQSWDGFKNRHWIGIGNYREMLGDAMARLSFSHSFQLGVFITLFTVAAGLMLALMIYRMGRIEGTVFRFILFSPVMIPGTIIAILFSFIYSPVGVLNQALEAVGLDSLTRVWLGESHLVLPSIVLVEVYRSMGIAMLILFTSLQMVPVPLLEVGRMDGITPGRQFVSVVFPLIKPMLQLTVVLVLVSAFRTFDTVRVLTNGGPGSMSKIVPLYMIETAFQYNQFGYSASMGVAFTAMLLLTVAIARKLLGGESYEF